jgi:serine/threonine protein kinase/Flp pilus assembly protein TadD
MPDSNDTAPSSPAGYHIQKELGRGGMGVVYLARQTKLNRFVALKMLSGRYGAEDLKRFLAEAETAAGLDHTNIAHIFDAGEHEGAPYYSMEFVRSGSLADRLRRGPLDVAEAVKLVIDIARALDFAHRNGVVHRDMKPGNILIDSEGMPKVADFGIAKRLSADVNLTRAGFIIGTPTYMSPEQATGGTIGPAADIYSLGAILYEVLAGRPPFLPEESETAITTRVVTENPVSPAWHRPGLARDLETICLKCLAKEPAHRYRSAGAVAEDLQRFLDDQPILARPRHGFFGTTARKTGAVVATLLLLGLGFAFSKWLPRLVPHTQAVVPAPAQVIPEKSIAVLPFENLSANQENAFFADGVQDEILTELSRISDLKVISRTSVAQYKSGVARNMREIGRDLGVAHLLEGSVQRTNDKIRVNAQLIDARSDAHLWANSYDRPLGDVFAIQSEIAKVIADQLHAKISPSEKSSIEKPPTTDLAAYDFYLQALTLYADATDQVHAAEKLPQAAQHLDQAVARDPNFLLAWCRLAKVHCLIYWQGHDHTPHRLELAHAAVQSALNLQPNSGEAHLALADYYYRGFRDYVRARTELEAAQRTLPNNSEVFEYTAYIGRRQGRWEEATKNLEHALELDPRSFFMLQQLALAYEAQRRYADQTRAYARALKIKPGDPATRMYRALVELIARANVKPFQETLATLVAEDPSVASDVDDPLDALCERTPAAMARALTNYPSEGVTTNGVTYPYAYWEGVFARCQNDEAKAQAAFANARKIIAALNEKQPGSGPVLSLLGMIDAGLGRKEDAIREGRRACELLPIEKDAIDGVALAVNLAQIYAWVGERDLAIEQIAAVEKVPNYLSYGFLKLQPIWDSLRGDPKFEAILSSLAPNDEKK